MTQKHHLFLFLNRCFYSGSETGKRERIGTNAWNELGERIWHTEVYHVVFLEGRMERGNSPLLILYSSSSKEPFNPVDMEYASCSGLNGGFSKDMTTS